MLISRRFQNVFIQSRYFHPNFPSNSMDARTYVSQKDLLVAYGCRVRFLLVHWSSYVHLISRTVRVPLFIAYKSYFVSVSMCESVESTTFVGNIFSDFPCNKRIGTKRENWPFRTSRNPAISAIGIEIQTEN